MRNGGLAAPALALLVSCGGTVGGATRDSGADATLYGDAEDAPSDATTEAADVSPADANAVQDAPPDSHPLCALDAAAVPTGGGCAPGSVTFRLTAGPRESVWSSNDSPWPDANWLTIFCPSGGQLFLAPTGLTGGADCTNCDGGFVVGIGAGALETADAAQDYTRTWNGRVFLLGMGCADSTQFPLGIPGACLTQVCAPAGRYVARMCSCKGSPTVPSCDLACIDVPFDYPSAGEVSASL